MENEFITGGWGGISEPDLVTPHSVVLFLPDNCSYHSRRASVELRLSLIALHFSFFYSAEKCRFSFIFFIRAPYCNKQLARILEVLMGRKKNRFILLISCIIGN